MTNASGFRRSANSRSRQALGRPMTRWIRTAPSPTPLQETAIGAIVAMGPRIAAALIAEKFAKHGIHLSRTERRRLVQHLAMPGGADTFSIRRSNDVGVASVLITPEDVCELERRLHRLGQEGALAAVQGLDDTAKRLLRSLKYRWPKEARRQLRSLRGFCSRLRQRWDRPFNLLSLLLTVFRESGEAMAMGLRSVHGDARPFQTDVLIRLHARACQVAAEILALLETGFADGAMARWRTLHETAVTAFFIQEGGEALAERYVLHQIVESWRAAKSHVRHHEALKQKAIGSTILARLEARHRALIARYKKPFGEPYGWAAERLGKDRPSFADIETAVNIDHLRPYYQLASHPVHANPKALYFKLGLPGKPDLLLAGASNYGLADPGQNVALSLFQVSVALMAAHPTLDAIVAVKLLGRLERETGTAFVEVQRTIAREERILRKAR